MTAPTDVLAGLDPAAREALDERCARVAADPTADPGAAPGGRPRGGPDAGAPRASRATPRLEDAVRRPPAAGPGRRAATRTPSTPRCTTSTGSATPTSGAPCCAALPHLRPGRPAPSTWCTTRCAPTTRAWSPRPWGRTRGAARRRGLAAGRAQVPVRRRAAAAACAGARGPRPTTSWPGWSPTYADERRAAGPAGARTDALALPHHRLPRGRPDAHLRPPHPHDLAHHRRLRGDARRRGARPGRAGVLAGPAAHQRRLVRRLLRRAGRLGAVPRRAVRHRPPLHDRAQPQGGQRPALHAGARRAAALPRQGRRRRGRRDRLRLDDARGGEGVRRASSSSRSSSSCRCWCTPRTATRRPAPGARWTWSRRRASRPGGCWSTTSTR